MDMGFMKIFDVIIGVLGFYLIYSALKHYKARTVDTMLITVEEQQLCKDMEGLSTYLMPKSGIFGSFCVLFGIQGALNDFKVIEFPYAVNIAFLIAFLVVWFVFSFAIRKAKRNFLSK